MKDEKDMMKDGNDAMTKDKMKTDEKMKMDEKKR
jgi:hypothetical protein